MHERLEENQLLTVMFFTIRALDDFFFFLVKGQYFPSFPWLEFTIFTRIETINLKGENTLEEQKKKRENKN